MTQSRLQHTGIPHLWPAFSLALVGALLLPPLQAQQNNDEDEPDYSQIEELIVTARKREEDLQQAPISISAFSGEGLEARGIGDLSEIGEITPNLVFDFTGPIAAGSSAASVYIRGIGQLDWALPTDPGVGIYVDGVYIARSIGGVLDLLDLERVEVLRGPQGTLFGRNTIGGAISLTTRKPSLSELWGDVAVQAGSYNQTNVSAKVNIPLGESAALGLSINNKERDGYVVNAAGPDLGSENSLAYRLAFRYNPDDNLDLNITYDATQERETPAPNVLVAAYENPGFSFANLYNSNFGYNQAVPDYNDGDGAQNTAEIAYQMALTTYNALTDAQKADATANPMPMRDGTYNHPDEGGYRYVTYLRSQNIPIASAICTDTNNAARLTDPTCFNSQWVVGPFNTHSEHKSRVEFTNTVFNRPLEAAADLDLSGLGINLLLGVGENMDLRLIYGNREIVDGYWARDADHAPLSILQTLNDYDHEQTTFEAQLLGNSTDNRLNWIVGLYSFEESGCHLDIVELPGSVFDSGGCIDNSSTAFFGQVSYEINATLAITGGLRQTEEDKQFTALSKVGFDFGFNIPAGVLVLPDTPNNISSSETDPYLSLAIRASDNANLYVSYATGFKGGGFDQRTFPPSSVVPGFQPEFATTIEFGFKTLWSNNRLRLNGAVFMTAYSDLQVVATRNDPTTQEIGNFTQNAAEASINGVEVELQAVPVPNMLLEAGLGILDASYDTISPSVKAGNAPLQESFKLVNTPSSSINLALQHRFEFNGSTLIPRIELNQTSEVHNNALNSEILRQPSLTLMNFSLQWASSSTPVSVTLNIRNLTDETYLVTGFDNAVVGVAEAVYALPQTVAIRAKYEF